MEVRPGGASEKTPLLGRAEPIKVNIVVRILRAIARLFFPSCFPNAQEREAIEKGRVKRGAPDIELANRTDKAASRSLDRGGAIDITAFGLEAPVVQRVDSQLHINDLHTQLTAFERSCSKLGTLPHRSLYRDDDLTQLKAQIEATRSKLAELRNEVNALFSTDAKASLNKILDRSEQSLLEKEESIGGLESIVAENSRLLNAEFTWDDAKTRLLSKREAAGFELSKSFINEVASRYEKKAIEESAKSLESSLKSLMPKGKSFSDEYKLAQFEGGIDALNHASQLCENAISKHLQVIEDFEKNIKIKTENDLQDAVTKSTDLENKLKNVGERPRIEIPKIEEKRWVDLLKKRMELIENLALTRLFTDEETRILREKKDALNEANQALELAMIEREEHWNSAPIEALPYMRNPNKLKYAGNSPWITKDQSDLEAIAIAAEAANAVVDYLINAVSGNAQRERSLSNPLKKPFDDGDRSALLASYQLQVAVLEEALSSSEKSFEDAHIRRVERLQEINSYQNELQELRDEISIFEEQVDANRQHLVGLRKEYDSRIDEMSQLAAKIQAHKNINHALRNLGQEPFKRLKELCEGILRQEVGIEVTDEEKAAGDQKYFEIIPKITGLPLGSAGGFAANS